MIDAELLPLSDRRRTLRPLSVRDAEAYAAGTRDPLVQRYAHLPEPEYTPESVKRLARTDVRQGLERGDLAVLSIVDGADTFLGSLVLFDVRTTSAEVGFWLRSEARGAGHGVGSLELAARLVARSGLPHLTARTLARNVSSQRTLERAGFQLASHATGTTPAGEQVPLMHYRRESG